MRQLHWLKLNLNSNSSYFISKKNTSSLFLQRLSFIQVPDDILIDRCVGRRLDPVTGRIYHINNFPPENDEIKERLITRPDDTEDKVSQPNGDKYLMFPARIWCFYGIIHLTGTVLRVNLENVTEHAVWYLRCKWMNFI